MNRAPIITVRNRQRIVNPAAGCVCAGAGYVEIVWAGFDHRSDGSPLENTSEPYGYPLCYVGLHPCTCARGRDILESRCKRYKRQPPADWETVWRNCGFRPGDGEAFARKCRAMNQPAT